MMNYFDTETGIEVKTIGDSRGYLWKIIMDRKRGIGKIEKVSGLNDVQLINQQSLDGSIHALETNAVVSDDMQKLTRIIESRFQVA